ncbi:hypothetical protein BB559_004356 [Furculomyces boomerangus]|uniref:Uncharacterized protein n=2 Tax=Harpellales TaxID=61421 RepID=A0A2T9YF63_9FUNG|nr:hypothetical protein BB559_004356 [Furculomyces boomerangus]PVZ99884.1 hypothetical protein BB558_004081 [Smittium angustum]
MKFIKKIRIQDNARHSINNIASVEPITSMLLCIHLVLVVYYSFGLYFGSDLATLEVWIVFVLDLLGYILMIFMVLFKKLKKSRIALSWITLLGFDSFIDIVSIKLEGTQLPQTVPSTVCTPTTSIRNSVSEENVQVDTHPENIEDQNKK